MTIDKKIKRVKFYLYVEFQGHGPDVGVEVEGGVRRASQPLGHVLGVAQRGAQGDHPDWRVQLAAHKAHARAHNLVHGLEYKRSFET